MKGQSVFSVLNSPAAPGIVSALSSRAQCKFTFYGNFSVFFKFPRMTSDIQSGSFNKALVNFYDTALILELRLYYLGVTLVPIYTNKCLCGRRLQPKSHLLALQAFLDLKQEHSVVSVLSTSTHMLTRRY